MPRPARRGEQTLGAPPLAWLRTLPDHRLLDRLIGGRVWIVLLGGLLVGIVTMQLTLLRWNAGIGRAVERTSQLEQRNAALRLSISELSDTNRILALATQMGFVMPLQGSPRFLSASAADADQALTTMRVPDPAAAVVAATAPATTAVDTTTSDPSATTTTDPATTADPPATTAPVATTTPPAATAAPTTATGTAAPTTQTPVAGGASAPPTQSVGPQG